MSFSDAIGQVDQIVQWEQQLANPAALTQSTTTAQTGTAAPAGATDSTGGASFTDALAQAQAQEGGSALSMLAAGSNGTAAAGTAADGTAAAGTATASSLLGGGDSQLLSALQSASLQSASSGTAATAGTYGSAATSVGDPRVQSMIQEADSLVGKPYVWGGGHNNFGPQSGYDCSGFVSAVLHAGGYLSSPQDTATLPSAPGIESGPGQYVTIYDRNTPRQEGHVIIEIDGQFYESGGEQGSWGGGGGVAKISTPSASYLSTFNQVLHPAGL